MPGLYFGQLKEGQVFEHPWTRTVTETDKFLCSSMTMNPAKLHIDAAYGATTEFDQPIVNSLYTLRLMIGMTANDTTYGTTVANLGMEEVRFPKPVFQGDALQVRSSVVASCRRSALMLGQG